MKWLDLITIIVTSKCIKRMSSYNFKMEKLRCCLIQGVLNWKANDGWTKTNRDFDTVAELLTVFSTYGSIKDYIILHHNKTEKFIVPSS